MPNSRNRHSLRKNWAVGTDNCRAGGAVDEDRLDLDMPDFTMQTPPEQGKKIGTLQLLKIISSIHN